MNPQYNSLNALFSNTAQRQPEIVWHKTWVPAVQEYRWYWSLEAGNGKIVAIGGEGFNSYANMVESIKTVARLLPVALNRPFKEKQ